MVDAVDYHVTVSSQGRVVLPAPLRKALGLNAGDTLNLTLDSQGVVRMVTARQLADNLWAAYADAEEAPVGTAAVEVRELRDADRARAEVRYDDISARRARVDRTEDELEAELFADLAQAGVK